METFSALLTLCAGNSPVTGEFPAHRPVTRIFYVFFDLRLNKRLSKQPWGWWFETWSLWRHGNGHLIPCPPGRTLECLLRIFFFPQRKLTVFQQYCTGLVLQFTVTDTIHYSVKCFHTSAGSPGNNKSVRIPPVTRSISLGHLRWANDGIYYSRWIYCISNW